MNFEEVREMEMGSVMQTYGRVPVALVKGHGAVAEDIDGKTYIDFTSGIGVNALGFSDPEWARAVAEQAGQIQHMSNYYYCVPQIELAKELTALAGMDKVFFCNSGAEANECAVKLARRWGVLNGKGSRVITLGNSFHGRTLTTLAATGQDVFHVHFTPLTEGFVYAEANDIESVRALADDSVCAVLMEMVQGEGGVIPMDEAFVQEVRALCDEKKMLLMIDEVQTGVGRTGTFYAYQGYGIQPDVVTTAKGIAGGLPMGACLCSAALSGILTAGMNGSTFGGNPVACAGALSVIRRVGKAEFLQDVQEKGAYMMKKFAQMPGVSFVRGRGMMIGVKLSGDQDAHDVLVRCAQAGLLVLTAKDLIRFLPPLTITYDEIDRGLEIFASVIA